MKSLVDMCPGSIVLLKRNVWLHSNDLCVACGYPASIDGSELRKGTKLLIVSNDNNERCSLCGCNLGFYPLMVMNVSVMKLGYLIFFRRVETRDDYDTRSIEVIA